MKKLLLVLLAMGVVVSSGQVLAKDGFYMGMDVGVAVAPEMDVQTGGIDDWTTDAAPEGFPGVLCDQTIFGDVQTPQGACAEAPPPWGPATESFDGGSGILAGLALGYRLGSFRVEGEYFYRGARYGSTDEPYFPADDWRPSDSTQYGGAGATGGGGAEDAVDNLMSHNFFANLYYDFRSDSKFTPYVGVGIGLAQVSVDYRTRWHRNPNGDEISAIEPPHGGAELNQRLAGLLTNDEATMTDTLFGYQALAGVDYQVSEPFSIGLKFRYAMFGEFEDDSEYTRLRGHASVAGNPPRPVTYYIRTDDIQFWGVSLNMKYQF